MTKKPLASAISSILTVGAIYATAPALAQDQTDDAMPSADALEEVIVTGSRIRKDVFTNSTPMDIIDVGEASIAGIANVGQLLQTNTAALGSPQVTSATSFQFVENGGLGTATVSLRGLGANRTLVLLNGRRAGPSGIRGSTSSFDLNVMPLATIQRVEILKDGASSIYGSDAVAGVVNIITKKGDGATFDAYLSIPSDSGGEESRLTASWGKSFNRGNFRVTADYNKREHLRRGERDYFSCGNQYIFDQQTGERADNVDPRTGDRWCEDLTWGHIWVYDYNDVTNVPDLPVLVQFDYDGDLGQHIPGFAPPANSQEATVPAGWFPVEYDVTSDAVTNDNHPFQDRESLFPQTELTTVYAEAEYFLTEDLTVYGEALFNRRETTADGYRQYWSYIYSGDWATSFGGGGTQPGGSSLSAAEGWFGDQWYSPTAITDHADSSAEIDYLRFVAGLRGSLTENWDWDLSFQYSDSDATYTDDVIYSDSIFDNNFSTGSCVGTVSSVRGVPCVDVPWLDPELMRGNISDEVRDFLFGVETGSTTYTQWSVDGFVTGEAYELPAGPLGVAVGFHYREDEINDTPGAVTVDPVTGDSNNWRESGGITTGDDSTVAVFAEVDVPLITDVPGVENLTLNASARYTDVDSYGDDTTWKVGLNWQVSPTFRLRANKGTSFRTPALFELFLSDEESTISQRSDVCRDWAQAFIDGDISQNVRDNCAADPRGLPPDYTGGSITPTVITGGGLGVLEAETSESKTFGFIWQPEFANLSMSLDYFDIEVNDEVDQIGGVQIILSCYESQFGYAFGGTEPLCDLFDRSSINFGIDNVMDSFINIAKQRNRGYDFQLQYDTDLPWGNIKIELDAARQVEDFRALFEETSEDLNGLVGDPEWVGETRVTFARDAWTLFWGANYVGTGSNETKFGRTTVNYRGNSFDAVLGTDAMWYHAFSASYEMDNGLLILAGVANAFDQHPPQLTRQGVGTDQYTMVGNALLASQYDPLGQRFFLNLTMTFE